jgi:hypothetical protein
MFLIKNGKPVHNYVKEEYDLSLLLALDSEHVILVPPVFWKI